MEEIGELLKIRVKRIYLFACVGKTNKRFHRKCFKLEFYIPCHRRREDSLSHRSLTLFIFDYGHMLYKCLK